MPSINDPNIEMLEVGVAKLGHLVDDLVFLGGCATGLLLTDDAAPPPRVTRDIDVIIEVASLSEYHSFNAKLRSRGFSEDISPGAPICRWKSGDIILDVMPTDPELLGFGNQWFTKSFQVAHHQSLPSGKTIRVLPAPYFMATKIEAFYSRGIGDFLLSKDIEDLVTVLDGRPEIVKECLETESELKAYLTEQLTKMVKSQVFLDALPGLLPPDTASQARVKIILGRIERISTVQH